MHKRFLSMRWWLALVFAIIVAATALFVAEVMTRRSEAAFLNRAQELAAGTVIAATNNLRQSTGNGGERSLNEVTADTARERRVALFLFDGSGNLLTASKSNGVEVSSIEDLIGIVGFSLQGERVIESTDSGRKIVVALPMRNPSPANVVVGVVSRPDLVAAGRIVHGKVIGAVVLAVGFGALIGIVVAFVITSRLRRIAQTAMEIGGGDFAPKLSSRFPDELGQLAEAIDRMRLRLSDSFEKLEGERSRLARLLEQLQEGVLAVNSSLRIVYANRRARLFLRSAMLNEGDPLPEDSWLGPELSNIARGLFVRGAGVIYHRISPDNIKTYAVAGVPARVGVGLLVITDVSLQERRERAEREFVANAAHELRTPLSAIAGAAEALQSGALEQPADRDRFIAIIGRQTARLGRLVQALLALARVQTGAEQLQLEKVKIKPLLDEVAAEAIAGGAIVETECSRNLSVVAHGDLLRQAIENLVSNAFKYGDGVVRVRARKHKGERIRIEVVDSGKGIDADQRERVFDRFFRSGRRDGEGFGLGLSIVREVVSALSGEVEIDSGRGKGTRVSIILPEALEMPA
jgi:two-component system sensor histidine kinase VicK